MIRIRFQPPVGDAAWDKWLDEGKKAADAMGDDPTVPHQINAALYKRERDRLLQATHKKCAYCEIWLTPGQRKGDVEHYRPKGRVRGRDGKLVKVNHQGAMVQHPGYYWLAYDYTNLLPCCSACNRRAYDAGSGLQTGKSDIFPTINNTWAASRLWIDAEQPALLNPWLDTDDPALHLAFDPTTGRVMGLTDRGRETIDILGLNRDGLPEARLKACHSVIRATRNALSDSLAAGVSSEDDNLLQAVVDGSAEFSAICRQAIRDKRAQMAPMLALLDSL
jgi:hypothetical protein